MFLSVCVGDRVGGKGRGLGGREGDGLGCRGRGGCRLGSACACIHSIFYVCIELCIESSLTLQHTLPKRSASSAW